MSLENMKEEPVDLANVKLEIKDEELDIEVKTEPEVDTVEDTIDAEESTVFIKREPACVSNEPECGNNIIPANGVVKQEVSPPDDTIHDSDVLDKPVIISNKYSATKFIKKKQRSEIAQYSCNVCQKRFPKKQLVIDHKINDSDNCKKQFIDTFKFIPDESIETAGRRLNEKIKYDGTNFSVPIPGLRMFPGRTFPRYSCDLCGKDFARYGSLRMHKEIHDTNTCNVCLQSFATSAALAKHTEIYSSKTKYSCQFCRRQFKCSLTLKEHEKVHFKGKSFYCDRCDEEFDQKRKLIAHSKIHERKNNYTPCFH